MDNTEIDWSKDMFTRQEVWVKHLKDRQIIDELEAKLRRKQEIIEIIYSRAKGEKDIRMLDRILSGQMICGEGVELSAETVSP